MHPFRSLSGGSCVTGDSGIIGRPPLSGKNSNAAGGNERGCEKMRDIEEEAPGRREKRERERGRKGGRKKDTAERSFEVAAGSFTFRNEIPLPSRPSDPVSLSTRSAVQDAAVTPCITAADAPRLPFLLRDLARLTFSTPIRGVAFKPDPSSRTIFIYHFYSLSFFSY